MSRHVDGRRCRQFNPTTHVVLGILLAVVGVQLALAIGMSLVDSYRRRGKKPKPFPTTPPRAVEVGDGTITTYTFGTDLYADMLAAIEGLSGQLYLVTVVAVAVSRVRTRRDRTPEG